MPFFYAFTFGTGFFALRILHFSVFTLTLYGRKAWCFAKQTTHNKMKIGIIVAMDKEFAQLLTLVDGARTETRNGRDFTLGRIGNNDIVLQKCGIGKVNAAVGAVEMIDAYKPELIISTGCAGGADVSLNVADVVVSTACQYHDVYCGSECDYGQVPGLPTRFLSVEAFVKKATSLRCPTKVRAGLIVTGDWFVDSRDKMRSILDNCPDAMAVDMESAAIAHACSLRGVPFVSFRIISDIPLKDNKAQMYFDFWARMAEGSFEVTKAFLAAL